MLQDLFEKIGFTAKEATLYTLLYQRGPNPVSTLAKLSGILRTSTYDILKSLIEKGLIISFRQGATTYFAIDDVKKIYLEQKEKVQCAEKIVKELRSIPVSTEGAQINYYKGIEGFREMHEDTLLHPTKEIIGWLNIDNFYMGLDQKGENSWTRKRYQKGIKVRLLLQDSKRSRAMKKNDPELNREIRIIPQGSYPFQSSCYLYENYISLFHTENDLFTGIRIRSSAFYQLYRQAFEMCWNLLR